MRIYEVVYTADAACDLISISDGIISEYGDAVGASRTVNRIMTKCNSLAVFPEVAPIKLKIENREIRLAHIKKFIIVYAIDKVRRKVIVYRIVGSSLDIESLIAELNQE